MQQCKSAHACSEDAWGLPPMAVPAPADGVRKCKPFLLISLPNKPLLRHTGLRTGMSRFVSRKPRKLTTTLSSTCSNIFWLEPWSLHRAYTTGPNPTIASARSAGGVPPAIMMPLSEEHTLS